MSADWQKEFILEEDTNQNTFLQPDCGDIAEIGKYCRSGNDQIKRYMIPCKVLNETLDILDVEILRETTQFRFYIIKRINDKGKVVQVDNVKQPFRTSSNYIYYFNKVEKLK